MKIAFATKSLENVDDHFGFAKSIAVYEVNKDGYQFLEFRTTEDIPEEEYDKINAKIDMIKDCAIVYVLAIGGTAAAKVVKAKIHPVKVAEPTPIKDILDKLVEVLNTNPPPWLKKAMLKEENIEDVEETEPM